MMNFLESVDDGGMDFLSNLQPRSGGHGGPRRRHRSRTDDMNLVSARDLQDNEHIGDEEELIAEAEEADAAAEKGEKPHVPKVEYIPEFPPWLNAEADQMRARFEAAGVLEEAHVCQMCEFGNDNLSADLARSVGIRVVNTFEKTYWGKMKNKRYFQMYAIQWNKNVYSPNEKRLKAMRPVREVDVEFHYCAQRCGLEPHRPSDYKEQLRDKLFSCRQIESDLRDRCVYERRYTDGMGQNRWSMNLKAVPELCRVIKTSTDVLRQLWLMENGTPTVRQASNNSGGSDGGGKMNGIPLPTNTAQADNFMTAAFSGPRGAGAAKGGKGGGTGGLFNKGL